MPLRQEILRPGLPAQASHYPQDDLQGTVHLAALLGDRVVGCTTLFPEDWLPGPGVAEPGWRIRGMATVPDLRGRGVGSTLVQKAQSIVLDRGGSLLWCNARTVAVDFYRTCGFEIVGEEFLAEMDIPHRKAIWRPTA
jgi:GNAT superfamily N-acetyltransferase